MKVALAGLQELPETPCCSKGRYLPSDLEAHCSTSPSAQVCDPPTLWNAAHWRYNQQNSSGSPRNAPLGEKSLNKLEKCERGHCCLNNCPVIRTMFNKEDERSDKHVCQKPSCLTFTSLGTSEVGLSASSAPAAWAFVPLRCAVSHLVNYTPFS